MVVWGTAALDALACIARETHVLGEGPTSRWCRVCDTGFCNDCGEPLMYHELCGWYHHIYPTANCFLSANVCEEVRT